MKTCGQVSCSEPAGYRYTWPGKDEALICPSCMPKLANVARAMGLHLQIIPLTVEELEIAELAEEAASRSELMKRLSGDDK